MDLAGNEPAGGRVPGSFGNELEAAVLQYQRDHVLTADGIARRNTFKSLMLNNWSKRLL